MKVEVHKITGREDLELAHVIRRKVFVEEQQVDLREEYDEFEESSVHFLARLGGRAAGTARWRKTEKGYKLERFAVLKEFRGKGIGSALVRAVLEDLPAGAEPVYLHAQLDACSLYERAGFSARGELFQEAGIWHRLMYLGR